jgi:hypothetical protein
MSEYEKYGVVYYANILAKGHRSQPLLERMKTESHIPIVLGKDDEKVINGIGLRQMKNNQNADSIYMRTVISKFGR